MDNGKPPIFNMLFTEEQVEVMYNSVCLYQSDTAEMNMTPTYKVAIATVRQKIVNLRDAIKRRKNKEKRA